MIPRIIAQLLVLALSSCANLEIVIPVPDRPPEEAMTIDAMLVSDSDLTISYGRDCPEGTAIEDREKCPMGLEVVAHSEGLEGGVVTGLLGLAASAAQAMPGGGGGATVNVNDGGTVNMEPDP